MEAFSNFQIFEPPITIGTISKYPSLSPERYLWTITFFHHSFLPMTNLQRILEPKAILKIEGSLIPRPPQAFGALMIFQLIRWNLLELVLPPCRRNLQSSWAIADFILHGVSNKENWKIGRVERTYLISTTLPARFSQKDPHWWNIAFILSNIWFQEVEGRDFKQIGMPRYLKVCHFSAKGKFNIFAIGIDVLGWVFQA